MANTPDNPFMVAADIANMQAGASESITDNIGSFTHAALVSGFASIYNTGADLINVFGGDIEKIDVAKNLTDNDSDLGAYYKENKNAIDVVGFAVTSLVPGGLALKGLQMAKAGTLIGPYGRALGFFSDNRTKYLNAAIEDLASSGGTIYGQINRNKLLAMGWGAADQILQVAAFETAVATTMKQSPLLEKDEFSTVVGNIIKSSVAFGLLGGGIEAIAIHSAFKGASKIIDSDMRKYDILKHTQGDMPEGHKAYYLLQSMLELPKEGKNLEYMHRFLPEGEKMVLPTKEAFEAARESATRRGWGELREMSSKIAGGDTPIADAFAHFIEKKVVEMQQAGTPDDQILDLMQGYLLNVSKVNRVEKGAADGLGKIGYVTGQLSTEALAKIRTTDDFLAAIVTRAPTSDTLSKTPYEFVGEARNIKIGLVGESASAPVEGNFARFLNPSEAFDAGFDAVMLRNGTVRINPESKVIVHRADPILLPRQYFHIPTGSFSFTAFPTIADLATSARPLSLVGNKDAVVAGLEGVKVMKQFDEFPLSEIDSIRASSRYAWVAFQSGRKEEFITQVPAKVAATDFPMLERIFQEGASKHLTVEIVNADGISRTVEDILNFGTWLRGQKLSSLQQHLAENGAEDLLSLGVKLNVEPNWIGRAIASNFVNSEEVAAGFSIPLHRSLFPANVEMRWDFSGNIKLSNELVASNPAPITTVIGGKEVKAVTKDAANVMVQHLPDGAGNSIYGILGAEYAVKIGEQQANDAFGAVFGAEKLQRIVKLDADAAIKIADQRGAGPSTFGFANADYGDPLRATLQYDGQLVNIWTKERSNASLTGFQAGFIKIADNKEAAAELGILDTALRKSAEQFTVHPENSKIIINIKALVKNEDGQKVVSKEKLESLKKAGIRTTFEIKNDDVAEHISRFVDINRRWVDERKVLYASRGWNLNWNPDVIHVPPVDTGRFPFFAFVRQKPGFIGASSEVSMITARTESQLRALAAEVPINEFEVIFKSETKDFYKAKDSYDYALTIKEPQINSALEKVGRLANFFPETSAANVIEDYVRHIQKQEASIVRLGMETVRSQLYADLRSLGKQFEQIGTSKAQADVKKFKSQIENPFEEYIKMGLDISKRSEYTLMHEANEFTESLGKTAYRVFGENKEKALQKLLPWEEANKLAERYGIAGPYRDADAYIAANSPADKSLTKEFVAKANMFMVNFTLRLDMAQSLINIISTPVLLSTEMASIRNLVANDSALAGKLNELRSIAVPGENFRVPSTVGLIAGAIKEFWGPEKNALIARYTSIGAIKDTMSKYHEMIDHLSVVPGQAVSKYKELGDKAVEIGAKFSGNLWSEEFTRFVSANVMHRLTDPIVAAGKMSKAEQDAYMSIFVNRVQGNYLASQRPIAFQGVLGAAVSLFQTYQFNLLQQLFRHVENQDKRAVFTLMGMQGGL